MRYDFSYVEALHSRARRERSEAVYRLIIAPFVALLTRQSAPRKAAHHAARPHLAGQG